MTSVATRRAPTTGYTSEAKDRYRNDVWRTFSDMWGEKLQEQWALLLPSKEGLEIPVALRWGASEARLVCVDENPAIVANNRWRDVYPDTMKLGSSVGRAAERLADEGVRLGAANLDLCNKFSKQMLDELRRFGEADVLADTATVSLTLLKGREHPETAAALAVLAERCGLDIGSPRPFFAMLFMEELCRGRAWEPLRFGEYRSGSKNMVYLVAATASHEAMLREYRLRKTSPPIDAGLVSGIRKAEEWTRYRNERKPGRYRHGYLSSEGLYSSHNAGPLDSWSDVRWREIERMGALPLYEAMRELFPESAGAADAYLTGMLDWAYARWGRAAHEAVEEWKSDALVRLPWSNGWRSCPDLPSEGSVHLVDGDSVRHPGHRHAVRTQPFNTWRVNTEGRDA